MSGDCIKTELYSNNFYQQKKNHKNKLFAKKANWKKSEFFRQHKKSEIWIKKQAKETFSERIWNNHNEKVLFITERSKTREKKQPSFIYLLFLKRKNCLIFLKTIFYSVFLCAVVRQKAKERILIIFYYVFTPFLEMIFCFKFIKQQNRRNSEKLNKYLFLMIFKGEFFLSFMNVNFLKVEWWICKIFVFESVMCELKWALNTFL